MLRIWRCDCALCVIGTSFHASNHTIPPPPSYEVGGIAKRLFFMFFVLVFLGIYPLKRFLFLLGYGGLVGVGEEGEAAREAEKQ